MPPDPKEIPLTEAVQHIRFTCQRTRYKPFFFMVGAGLSFPPVPLATGIVEDCKQERGDLKEPPALSPMDAYSWWLLETFHSPGDRQAYLRRKIQGQCVSAANLRLAHLLLSGAVSNLVVTTNFDDHLSRALTLFGAPHVTCDHPETLPKIDLENDDDLQIVHVHGTYWFYDCSNLKGEIAATARRSELSPFSMRGFLDELLNRRSPIVVGYSGWSGDVFMSALLDRLRRSHKYNIYWFCYRRQDLDNLPAELKAHPNVFFVCPAAASTAEKEGGESSSGAGALATSKVKSIKPEEPIISATSVLEQFIRDFGIHEPPLTTDPLNFLAEQLERSRPTDEAGGSLYSLGKVIDRIRRAGDLERAQHRIQQKRFALLENLRALLRTARYSEALQLAGKIWTESLEAGEARELFAAVRSCADNLGELSERLSALGLLIDIGGNAARDPLSTVGDADIARALLDKGVALAGLSRSHEEITVYDDIVKRYGDSTLPALQEQVATALFYKGITLGELNRSEEEIAVYDEVVRRFGDSTQATLQEKVAKALFNKGAVLGQLNRSEEEVVVYDQVVRRFGDSTQAALQEQVAAALVNKGVTLGQLNRSEEGIAVYDEVVQRFGESKQGALREQVAMALRNKGVTLGQLNRSEEAIAIYDDVAWRFGDSMQAALQEQVATALFNKAVRLGQLNRSEEEIAIYDEVERRFGDSTRPALQERVAKALFNKGIALGQLNRSEEAITVYDEVVRRFGDSTQATLQEQVAKVLFNKAFRLVQLNRSEEAITIYDEVVRRFGDSTQAALQDKVAAALYNKGSRLGQLNRSEEAIAVYDEVVRRFRASTQAALQVQVAAALFNKGGRLRQLNRSEEAIAVYDDVARQFGDSTHADLQERVSTALFNKGVALRQLNRTEEAATTLTDLIRRYEDSTDPGIQHVVEQARVLLDSGEGRTEAASVP